MDQRNSSKVWFTDMRVPIGTSLLIKLTRLMKTAGMDSIDFKNKYVAIKMHFGEQGNLAFLRPNYARTVVDMITSLGESRSLPIALLFIRAAGKMHWNI